MRSTKQSLRALSEYAMSSWMTPVGVMKANIPMKHSNLGIRSSSDVALPAYLSSLGAARQLVQQLSQSTPNLSRRDVCRDLCRVEMLQTTGIPTTHDKRAWDDVLLVEMHRQNCLLSSSRQRLPVHRHDPPTWTRDLPSTQMPLKPSGRGVRIPPAIVSQQHLSILVPRSTKR